MFVTFVDIPIKNKVAVIKEICDRAKQTFTNIGLKEIKEAVCDGIPVEIPIWVIYQALEAFPGVKVVDHFTTQHGKILAYHEIAQIYGKTQIWDDCYPYASEVKKQATSFLHAIEKAKPNKQIQWTIDALKTAVDSLECQVKACMQTREEDNHRT